MIKVGIVGGTGYMGGEALRVLLEHPEIGRAGRVFNTRELVLSQLPYILIYRVKNVTVEVLRILHTSREWSKDAEY